MLNLSTCNFYFSIYIYNWASFLAIGSVNDISVQALMFRECLLPFWYNRMVVNIPYPV